MIYQNFFDTVRSKFGPLTTTNVAGFNLVLAEAIKRRTPINDLAYILATGWWESGKTMAPVEEAFYLGKKADAFRRKLRYYPFHGRGLVQLTWEANYKKASELTGIDLVANPDRAMEPKISVQILFDGMERGWFTGKSLDDYIDDIDEPDDEDLREFANARRIVNGTDKQVEIGKLSLTFENALIAAKYDSPAVIAPKPTPQPATPVPPPPATPPKPKGNFSMALAAFAAFAAVAVGFIVVFVLN